MYTSVSKQIAFPGILNGSCTLVTFKLRHNIFYSIECSGVEQKDGSDSVDNHLLLYLVHNDISSTFAFTDYHSSICETDMTY